MDETAVCREVAQGRSKLTWNNSVHWWVLVCFVEHLIDHEDVTLEKWSNDGLTAFLKPQVQLYPIQLYPDGALYPLTSTLSLC